MTLPYRKGGWKMAKFTQVIHGDFDRILKTIEDGVLDASVSALLSCLVTVILQQISAENKTQSHCSAEKVLKISFVFSPSARTAS